MMEIKRCPGLGPKACSHLHTRGGNGDETGSRLGRPPIYELRLDDCRTPKLHPNTSLIFQNIFVQPGAYDPVPTGPRQGLDDLEC